GALGALLYSRSIYGISWGLGLGSLAGAMAGYWILSSAGRLSNQAPVSKRSVTALLLSVWPISLTYLGVVAYVKMGILLFPWLAGPREAGIYAVAHKIVETSYIIPYALVVVCMPKFSNVLETGERHFRSTALPIFKRLVVLTAVWFVLGEIFSEKIIHWV